MMSMISMMRRMSMMSIGALLIILELGQGFNKIPQSRNVLGPLFDVLEEVALAPVPVQFMDIQPALDVQVSDKSWMSAFKPSSGLIPIFESSHDTMELPPASPTIPRIGAWKSLSDTKINPALFKSRSQLAGSLAEYLEGTFVLDHEHTERAMKKRGSLSSLSEEDTMLVAEALRICYIALWEKKTTRSVEDKFSRARGIAAVLGDLRVDTETVLAGILHEVVSLIVDTQEFFLLEELTTRFGQNVITLARNYAKLPKFMAQKRDYTTMRESENQLQMLVVSHEDYRTLYIRIADRVHTMRELKNLPLDQTEMEAIALEARNLYAPLAHKMGLTKIKGELEDLAFSIEKPIEFRSTKETQFRANKAHQDAEYSIRELIAWDPLLHGSNVSVKITSRVKGKYQLYLKAGRKGLKHTNEVRDALGMRIVLDIPKRVDVVETDEEHEMRSHELCYHLVEKIRSMNDWEAPSDGFKDYIAGSKQNGYQSLHQYLKSKAYGSFVEVQVRTTKMHINAEHGEAAHWHYKDMMYRQEIAHSKLYRSAWRSPEQLVASNPQDLFRMAKEQLLDTRVFVLLDDHSTVINLKKGCIALDAAFNIHSDLGLKTQSILIDGKAVKFNEELKHGQVIKVVRSQTDAVPLLTKLPWIGMLRDKNAQQIMRKHLRTTFPDVLIVIGLIQLLNTFMLNEAAIKQRLGDKPLDLKFLQRLAKIRYNGLSFEQYLSKLGSTYARDEIGNIVGNLVDIPGDSLKVSEFHRAFSWARMQAEEWEDVKIRDDVLLPFFNSANKQSESVKMLWYDLIGARSLEVRVQPAVSSVLSSSLQSVTGSRLTSRVSSRPPSSGNKFTVSRAAKTVMKPYSLVASSMPQGLMKAAKHAYANRVTERQ